LVSREALEAWREKSRLLQEEEARLSGKKIFPLPDVNQALLAQGSRHLKEPTPFLKLLKRPELDLNTLYQLAGEAPAVPPAVLEQIEIKYKYEGYINRQLEAVKQFVNLEKKRLPADFDYAAVPGLSNEVRQKLQAIRPHSLGQAARISGVTPAAIAILLVYLKRWPGNPPPPPAAA
jgi:tRNA uridine 5-carboxymethylaminomethyl modification enzyme